ncbi:MAG: hypothetical protein QOJ79_1253 [Actinomycetota bacterium]|jgi:hypothetical protein|nr:hypothetical protein [Actinomycetota bacterium]
MILATSFDVFLAYPPNRDGRVAELHVPTGDTVEIPAEVFEAHGTLMVTLFSQQEGPAWTYPLEEFRAALDRAATAVATGPT